MCYLINMKNAMHMFSYRHERIVPRIHIVAFIRMDDLQKLIVANRNNWYAHFFFIHRMRIDLRPLYDFMAVLEKVNSVKKIQ